MNEGLEYYIQGDKSLYYQNSHNNQFVAQSKAVWILLKHDGQSEVFKKQAAITFAFKEQTTLVSY